MILDSTKTFVVEPELDLQEIDIVCKEGVSLHFYETIKPWLLESSDRRLFFIEDRAEALSSFAQHQLNNLQVKIFFLESPIQKDAIAKKIGWLCAFKRLKIVGDHWDLIHSYHLAAHSIASDAADFGVGVFRHLKMNQQRSLLDLASLKGCLKGVPAVICGAGPSLEKNGHLLEAWKGKALIIAAGSSIHSMQTEPDLSIAFDPHIPLVRKKYFDVPLCMQSRVHPDSLTGVTGDLLYFPEGHFAFDAWICGAEKPFDSGWTAGTAGVAIAEYLGCSPIVLIGMDYCYRGQQKYADQTAALNQTPLVQCKDANDNPVWTQKDWLMAIGWLEQFANAHPELPCINLSSEGMDIPGFRSEAFHPETEFGGFSQIFQAASSLPNSEARLQQWTESLKRCHRTDLSELPEEEIAQELLLEPLWQIWAPLFERELMIQPEPASMLEKMAIQKLLFFNQVIQEHLDVE